MLLIDWMLYVLYVNRWSLPFSRFFSCF